jgi:SAM-dependent methyltransferase
MNEPERICPLCSDNGGFRDYLQWEGSRWVRCVHCGGGHREPYVPEVEDEDLTTRIYDTSYFESEFFDRRRRFAANQAAWLRAHYREGMTVLEIGPGLGLAAERFLESVPNDVRDHVVEPHPTFARFISERLGERVVVHTGDAESALQEAVDVTCGQDCPVLLYMDNVLEHFADPFAFLARLKKTLPPGSELLIDVPNERGLRWRCRVYKAIGGQPTASPAHINLFTSRSFDVALGKLGLRHEVRQRGIRRPEEVNCLPEGAVLSTVLGLLRVVPVDCMLGLANNLRVEVTF